MQHLLWVAAALLLGLPLLSFGLVVLFALTTRFDVAGVTLRDSGLRGLLATALAKVAVQDAGPMTVPVEVTIRKQGVLPLRVTVQDIELDLFLEDVFVSHVSDERSVTIAAKAKDRFRVPLNMGLDLRGRVAELMRLADRVRRQRFELAIRLEGHLVVRHWFFSRTLPVHQVHHTLLGEAKPRLALLVWDRLEAPAGSTATLTASVRNDYRRARLRGSLVVELYRDVRGRDPLHATLPEALDLAAGEERPVRFAVEVPATDEATRALYPVVYWGDDRLFPRFFRRECPRVWLEGRAPRGRGIAERASLGDGESPSTPPPVHGDDPDEAPLPDRRGP